MPLQQGSWRGCSREAVFVLQPNHRTQATALISLDGFMSEGPFDGREESVKVLE
jgi:hypothetical protein